MGHPPQNHTDAPDAEFHRIPVRTWHARHRNAFVARADFGPLYEDYYLHWLQHDLRLDSRDDQLLKDALAALALVLSSKTPDQQLAWTFNFQRPLVSLFVAGDNTPGRVAGRVWVEGLRKADNGLLVSEARRATGSVTRSTVHVAAEANCLRAVETLHSQSEQRPARFFHHGPEDILHIAAQPGCDTAWLASLNDDKIRQIWDEEELAPLETRYYHFGCGCTSDMVVSRVALLGAADFDHIFGEQRDTVNVHCPRCGAVFAITRESVEAARQA